MPIKTFRGLMADGAIDTVSLHTNNGSTGYIIKKFQIIPYKPFDKDQEAVVKIYKTPQTTATDEVDFSDQTLLAVAITTNEDTPGTRFILPMQVIFDKEIINQDIYITHRDQDASEACNYYIELEQVKLSLDENTVATLKDIRNLS